MAYSDAAVAAARAVAAALHAVSWLTALLSSPPLRQLRLRTTAAGTLARLRGPALQHQHRPLHRVPLCCRMSRFSEYQVIGRKLPSEKDANPKLYRMRVFAPNEVVAKSRFWYYLRKLRKVKKAAGELVAINQVRWRRNGARITFDGPEQLRGRRGMTTTWHLRGLHNRRTALRTPSGTRDMRPYGRPSGLSKSVAISLLLLSHCRLSHRDAVEAACRGHPPACR